MLKADLYCHILHFLIKENEKNPIHDDKGDLVPPDLVDIQFAMSDYSYLEPVKAIIDASKRAYDTDIEK